MRCRCLQNYTERQEQKTLAASFYYLQNLTREELIAEVIRLRVGTREHLDSSGHNLCWRHPELWGGVLPEPVPQKIAVPPWPKFMAGYVAYRRSLDKELPNAPVDDGDCEK